VIGNARLRLLRNHGFGTEPVPVGERRFRAPIFLVAALVLSGGCARQAPHAVPIPSWPDYEGRASYLFVPDPAASSMELPPDEEFIPPSPASGNSPPAYPERALEAGYGAAVVGLRIVLGTDGIVNHVLDSPVIHSTPGPFAADFRAAAESAVRDWLFHPAVHRVLADGEDYDEDGKPDFRRVTESRFLSVYLDIRFEFEILDGKGVVRTSGGPITSR
jgi:hypothetical protein